jgi:hypothetical protein
MQMGAAAWLRPGTKERECRTTEIQHGHLEF